MRQSGWKVGRVWCGDGGAPPSETPWGSPLSAKQLLLQETLLLHLATLCELPMVSRVSTSEWGWSSGRRGGTRTRGACREAVLGGGQRVWKEEGRWIRLESILPQGRCRQWLNSVTQCPALGSTPTDPYPVLPLRGLNCVRVKDTGNRGIGDRTLVLLLLPQRSPLNSQATGTVPCSSDVEANSHSGHTTRGIRVLDAQCSA